MHSMLNLMSLETDDSTVAVMLLNHTLNRVSDEVSSVLKDLATQHVILTSINSVPLAHLLTLIQTKEGY